MPKAACRAEGRSTRLELSLEVRARVEQHTADLDVATLGRLVKRGGAIVLAEVGIGAMVEKSKVVKKSLKGWRIVIPSYARPQRLKEATLSLLQLHNVPLERIYVFVANMEELKS